MIWKKEIDEKKKEKIAALVVKNTENYAACLRTHGILWCVN